MSHVIVIGGGIVGASAAYRLARANVKVTLIDRRDDGQATAAGAGIISPGANLRNPPGFFALAFHAVRYYPELIAQLAEDGETETGYEAVGALFVATSEEEAARLPEIQRVAVERRAAGFQSIGEVSRLDSGGARALFPALGAIREAIHLSGAVRLDGRLLCGALCRAAEKRGATIRHGSAELIRVGDRVSGVSVNGESLSADAVVIAGGAWSNALGAQLGFKLPVFPQRGQILHLAIPDGDTSRWPIVMGFHSHYMVTFPQNRVVVGATRETDSGYDYRMTAGGVHEVLSEALRFAPGLAGATVSEVRIGFRPATPDHLPVLGRAPGIRNLYLATGHGHSGLQLGPYSGAAVADVVLGKAMEADLTPFTPERFTID